MSVYQLTMVPEPPSEASLKSLLMMSDASKKLLDPPNFADPDTQLNAPISKELGYLRLYLTTYASLRRGNEAFIPMRKNALNTAVKHCDALIAALTKRIINSEALKKQFSYLSILILRVRMVCDAKLDMLGELEGYIANPNADRLAGSVKSRLSHEGQQLRGMTASHMAEYFSGFHFSMQPGTEGLRLYNDWVGMIDDPELRDLPAMDPRSVPPFPVYLEGQIVVPFEASDPHEVFVWNNPLNNITTVEYDGTEKKSAYRIEVCDGLMYENVLESKGLLRDPLTTIEGKNHAFIVDSKENIYVYRHKLGTQHHSTATAGRAVLSAGLIQVKDGKVTAVDDKSGHYAPTPRHMLAGLNVMQQQGVLSPEAILSLSFYKQGHLFSFRIADLLSAEQEGMDHNNLVRSAVDPSLDLTTLAGLVVAFTGDYQSDYYRGHTESHGDMIHHLSTSRPRQALRYTQLPGIGLDGNALQPGETSLVRQRSNRKRRNAMPLTLLQPVVVAPRKRSNALRPSQTPPPSAPPEKKPSGFSAIGHMFRKR